MNLNDAAGMALAFVLFVVVVGVGASVITGMQTSSTMYTTAIEPTCTAALAAAGQSNCTTIAGNATRLGLTGMTNLAQQSGTIGTIIGAAILIGIILTAFYVGRNQ